MAKSSNNINPFAFLAKNGLNDLSKLGNAIFNPGTPVDDETHNLENHESATKYFEISEKTYELIKNQQELFFTISNIVDKTNEKDKEIQNLRNNLSEYAKQNEELRKVNSTISNMVVKLQHENETFKENINIRETLTAINEELKNNVASLDKIKSLTLNNAPPTEVLITSINEIKNSVSELCTLNTHGMISEIKERTDYLAREALKCSSVIPVLEDLRLNIDIIKNDHIETHKAISELSDMRKDSNVKEVVVEEDAFKNQTIETLQNIIEKQGDAILELADKVRAQESQGSGFAELTAELDIQKSAAASLREQITELESKNSVLQKEVYRNKSLLTEKTWTESDIHALKQRIAELEKELSRAGRSDDNNPELKSLIESSLRDAETRVREAVKEKENIERRFKDRFVEMEAEVNDKNSMISQLEADNKDIRESLSKLTEYNARSKRDYETLEDKFEELREDAEKRISEIIEEYEESQKQIESYKALMLESESREKLLKKWGPLAIFKEKFAKG